MTIEEREKREDKIADHIYDTIEISVLEAMTRIMDGDEVSWAEPYIQDYTIDEKTNEINEDESIIRDDMFILPLHIKVGHDKHNDPLTRETIVLIDNLGEIRSVAVKTKGVDFDSECDGVDENDMDYCLIEKHDALYDLFNSDRLNAHYENRENMPKKLQKEYPKYKDVKKHSDVIMKAAYLNKVAWLDRQSTSESNYLSEEMAKIKNIDDVLDYIVNNEEAYGIYTDLTEQISEIDEYDFEYGDDDLYIEDEEHDYDDEY